MKKRTLIFFIFLAGIFVYCSVSENKFIFTLEKTIALPCVKGRIDHLAYDDKRQLVFICALGNNSVEVVDMQQGKVIHSIKNLSEPQGIAFIQGTKNLFVACGGNGDCKIFDSTYKEIKSIKLSSDADNVRYDNTEQKIYVGYDDGGMAVIDANSFILLSDIELDGHPESFQIDETQNKIFVNVPDKLEIEVIDLQTSVVQSKWKLTDVKSNFPMAVDETNHRLFIACRNPSKVLVMNSKSGKTITTFNCSGDADDVFYNEKFNQIFISCGEGNIDVFQEKDSVNFILLVQMATRSGARTSLFVPELKKIFLAVPATIGQEAELRIYKINN